MTGNEKTQTTRWLRLHNLGLMHASGADTASFLQGQLSNDLRELTPERALLAAFSSPKGRMLAVINLMRAADDILLELHRSVLDATLKRLRMFVLRSKVTLTDLAESWATLGLIGEQAAGALAAVGIEAPTTPLHCAQHGKLVITRRHGDLPRFTLQGPAADAAALADRFAQTLGTASEDDWKRLEIEAGLPTIYPVTSDHFVAQMCNLDQLGGISFNKGCYTGQEIIARLHYLGTLKRRMFRAQCAAAAAPGDAVFDASGDTQAVGEVVDALGGELLLVLQTSHCGGDLRLREPGGPAIHLQVST